MEDGIFVSQRKYAKSIVKEFGIDNASHKITTFSTHLKLYRDGNGVDVDQCLYRSMMDSLLYLKTSRPDITFVEWVCVRYQVNPKVSHLTQLKIILKYINRTYEYDILYSHDTNTILVGYYDADWTGSADDRKSTLVACFFLEIIWFIGSSRRKFVSHYLFLKLSTSLLEGVALSYSGWNWWWRSTMSNKCHEIILWQLKCYQYFKKSCSTQWNQAHWHSSLFH